MTNSLLKFAAPLLAAAATILPASDAAADTIYEAVDAVMMQSERHILITGIVAGATVPTTLNYFLAYPYYSERCERMATLAMSRPGKYQLTFVGYSGNYACKLSLRAP